MAMMVDVLIVGGGIGGLTAAHFLQKQGFSVSILEKSTQLSEIGAGLWLAPNALAALATIDLLAELQPLGWRIQVGYLRSTRSGLLQKVDFQSIPNPLNLCTMAIHRARLQKVLVDRLHGPVLRPGSQIISIVPKPDGVAVVLDTGETVQGRLLIGADGLRSQVRSLLFPAVGYRYSGTSSYRGIGPATNVVLEPHGSAEIWGPACRFGYSRISSTEVYWYLTFDARPNQVIPLADRLPHALALMQHFAEERSIVAATPAAQIIHTDIGDLRETSHWVQGHMALLGDAAHATTPNLGQGAAQAIEDAWALALMIKNYGLSHEALQAYRDARMAKAHWIVRQSWAMQRLCHIENPWLQRLRDLAVKLSPGILQEQTLKKMFRPEVGLLP